MWSLLCANVLEQIPTYYNYTASLSWFLFYMNSWAIPISSFSILFKLKNSLLKKGCKWVLLTLLMCIGFTWTSYNADANSADVGCGPVLYILVFASQAILQLHGSHCEFQNSRYFGDGWSPINHLTHNSGVQDQFTSWTAKTPHSSSRVFFRLPPRRLHLHTLMPELKKY